MTLACVDDEKGELHAPLFCLNSIHAGWSGYCSVHPSKSLALLKEMTP